MTSTHLVLSTAGAAAGALLTHTEDAIKAAVKDIKAKRSQGNESHSDSEAGGHKAEATA